MKTLDRIATDFHAGIPLTRRELWRALRETRKDFDERTALYEARQMIGALLDAWRHG